MAVRREEPDPAALKIAPRGREGVEDAMVSRPRLENSLEKVRASVKVPGHGIHGPETLAWEVGRENILFLGGGCAALLQLAHPYVAWAILQHSNAVDDPRDRFVRTFRNVWAMTFGDLEQAVESARAVHRVHSRVHGVIEEDVGVFRRGHRYRANDAEALLWVYATLLDTSVRVYEQTVRTLSDSEKENYLEESKRFAWLFGIPDRMIPSDWPAFENYMAAMLDSGVIAVGNAARRIVDGLFHPPNPLLAPAVAWYKAVTAGLLPGSLRGQFGLRFGRLESTLFRGSLRVLRGSVPWIPSLIRWVPAYRQALRRVADASVV